MHTAVYSQAKKGLINAFWLLYSSVLYKGLEGRHEAFLACEYTAVSIMVSSYMATSWYFELETGKKWSTRPPQQLHVMIKES